MSQTDGVVDPARRAARRRSPTSRSRSTSTGRASSASSPATSAARRRRSSQGLTVGSVFEDQKVFEVVVKGTPDTRRSVADIRNLLIDTPGGRARPPRHRWPTCGYADIPISIPRDVGLALPRRRTRTSAGAASTPSPSELEDRLSSATFPIEYHAEVLTQTTSSEINLGLDHRVGACGADRDLPADAGRRAAAGAGGACLRDAAGRARGRCGRGSDRRRVTPSDRWSASWRCSASPRATC